MRLLAEILPLHAAPAGVTLLTEIRGGLPTLLRRQVSRKPLTVGDLNMALVPPMWRRAVLDNPALDGAADRDAYVMCLLTQLHAALGRRDVFAEPSQRWADPQARLLDGPDWAAVRDDVLAGLGLTAPVEAHLADCATTLDAAWRQLAQRIEEVGPDASVRVVTGDGGRMRLSVRRLEKLGDPPSLVDLRKQVAAMLPVVDLPELLIDVHSWTGMLDAYTHVGGLASSMDKLPVTVAALLVADACNVGLVPVIHPGGRARHRGRGAARVPGRDQHRRPGRNHQVSRVAVRTAVADRLPHQPARSAAVAADEPQAIRVEIPGKIADRLDGRPDLGEAERHALQRGRTVRRGQGYNLHVTALPDVHRALLAAAAALGADGAS